MSAVTVPRSRLRPVDVAGVGVLGVRSRPGRAALTAAGIAIGIAALVAVVGVSSSSRADLLATLDRLGTNLLTVTAGQTFLAEDAELPEEAPQMIRRIGPVQTAAAVGVVDGSVRRTDHVPEAETGGIRIGATRQELLATLGGTLAAGRFHDDASETLPTVVLGADAARRLGLEDLQGNPRVWLADHWAGVIGILDPLPLAPELDSAALVGWDWAEAELGFEGAPGTVYVRTDPADVDAVQSVLAPTTNPFAPDEVEVSRPSDALEARAAADQAFTTLLLGLGGVALLVGGIGIANVQVIAVLERRTEIGVRRALGATRGHVRAQFLVEAVLLAGIGGVAGVALGAGITALYAGNQGLPFSIPAEGLAAGVAAALLVGGLAGLWPATRAAKLPPAEAVRPL